MVNISGIGCAKNKKYINLVLRSSSGVGFDEKTEIKNLVTLSLYRDELAIYISKAELF